MKLRIKKKTDGDAVVTFVRADGSTTSGRLGSGGFGAMHDLTHYVVECSLRLPSGFLGLLAQGWNIPDFEIKGPVARLPDEAVVAECIVGQLTNAVFGGQVLSVEEFNWMVGQAVAGVRPGATAPSVSAETLAHMQQQLDDLLSQWRALSPGQTLELEYSLS
jgi:hypothetical protein